MLTNDETRPAMVCAGGAVLWRVGRNGRIEVAVVHRPRYDDWSLPKGKLDPGETLHETAVREIAEETGFTCTLGRHLGRSRYEVPASGENVATKLVDYFAAHAVAGEFVPNSEVDELRWLAVADARSTVSYAQDRSMLATFDELPPNTTTVLLVRHAKAGKRSEWDGDDDLRPLSDKGWKQAEALRRLLATFGPSEVHAAPPVRCQQTVLGVAEDVGVPITPEPSLSETGYWPEVESGIGRLLAIAAGPGVPVICSQGGVIPDLIARLAVRSDLKLPELASEKGSVWVLSVHPASNGTPPRLVAADYLADAFPPA